VRKVGGEQGACGGARAPHLEKHPELRDATDEIALTQGLHVVAPASDPQAVEIEFWDSIKNSILATEYEAYIEQYPEGSFVALARVRLEAIEEDAVGMRDPHGREIELSFWESVRESDNPTLIQAYLEKYPNGEFSALAQIRIGELTPDSQRVIEGDK
jgi:hypothetical protein